MALRFFAIQKLIFFVSYTLAHQSFSETIDAKLDKSEISATKTADPTCLFRNPPVDKRVDYTYFPGIGGYKLHSEKLTWNQARVICEEEGGHLAIINSVDEKDAMIKVLTAETPHPDYVSLGFHDFYQKGLFVTIHGQNVSTIGYAEWVEGEPNGSGHCGTLHESGGLDDHDCDTDPMPFICELPIR